MEALVGGPGVFRHSWATYARPPMMAFRSVAAVP